MMTLARQVLAGWLLLPALGGPASADSATVPALLKPLDLVGYAARTAPPGLSGHTFDARPVAMAELRGKVVLVNFWASWCLECRPEMPRLERLHREFAAQGLGWFIFLEMAFFLLIVIAGFAYAWKQGALDWK